MERTIGDRIKNMRKRKDLTLEELGKMVGVSKVTIFKYEGDKINIPSDRIERLADVLGCTPGYLMGWETDPNEADVYAFNNIEKIGKKEIPLMLTPVHCGEPTYADNHVSAYYPVGEDLNVDFCLTCAGDSMTGAGIDDGDIVLVRRQPDVESGEIAVVSLGDEATLKRVYKHPEKGIIELRPANPAYESIILLPNDAENVRILGKVIVVMKFV